MALDLTDPMAYLWPGDMPRHFVETPPPMKKRQTAWRWWEEPAAPNVNDLLDHCFPQEDGNFFYGLAVALVYSLILLLAPVLLWGLLT